MAKKTLGVRGAPRGRFAIRTCRTQKRGAKGRFPAMRSQNPEADRVEIGSKQGAWLVAKRGAKYCEKSPLVELFCLGRIGNPAAEKPKQRLFVARKQFGERFRGTARNRHHQ